MKYDTLFHKPKDGAERVSEWKETNGWISEVTSKKG